MMKKRTFKKKRRLQNKKKSLITLTMMKKYSQENIRIKERKLCMISIAV